VSHLLLCGDTCPVTAPIAFDRAVPFRKLIGSLLSGGQSGVQTTVAVKGCIDSNTSVERGSRGPWIGPELWNTHKTRFPRARWTARTERAPPTRSTGQASLRLVEEEQRLITSGGPSLKKAELEH